MGITTKQYKDLDLAYEYFNKKLFDNKLPECLITFQRHPKVLGYHHFEKFVNRGNKDKVSEIALNPDTFDGRTDIEILSTLCHEMIHVQQYLIGDPPRKGYHDKGFASLMNNIGLQASSTGEPGGRVIGQSMSHYILEGGKFEIAAGAFLLGESKLQWNSTPNIKISKERKKTRKKFICPECLQQAWAKKTASLICGDCRAKMIIDEDEK